MSNIGSNFLYTDPDRYEEYRQLLGGIDIEWCVHCGSFRSVVHRHTGKRHLVRPLGDV